MHRLDSLDTFKKYMGVIIGYKKNEVVFTPLLINDLSFLIEI